MKKVGDEVSVNLGRDWVDGEVMLKTDIERQTMYCVRHEKGIVWVNDPLIRYRTATQQTLF